MKIIYKGRQKGKTTDLIKRSAERGGYIVCETSNECIKIQQKANRLNLNIKFPITYNEIITCKYYGRGIKEFYIDNAENFIQAICRYKVNTITLTKEQL